MCRDTLLPLLIVPSASTLTALRMICESSSIYSITYYISVTATFFGFWFSSLRPGIQPKLASLLTLYEGKKIIVGRDKLDVVKGVVQKLRAFEKLLADYPQWRGNVVLIQVTSPALSDSPKLERLVSEIVAGINGEYGSLDFIPVHH